MYEPTVITMRHFHDYLVGTGIFKLRSAAGDMQTLINLRFFMLWT